MRIDPAINRDILHGLDPGLSRVQNPESDLGFWYERGVTKMLPLFQPPDNDEMSADPLFRFITSDLNNRSFVMIDPF